ncbi:MAG TPA: hypothetical protein VK774_01800 [Solirubrobacteraceae bacterium]|jgi:hypothetical protein|nr:hypothetical protein [Solirubrobacteraceae bacterium]
MHISRLITVCTLAACATAVTAASASTLPGVAGTSITGGSEKATFQVKGGASITCPKSTATGEVLSTSESLAIINFGPKCTTAGLPVNSLGDAAGVILVHVEIRECPSSAAILELKVLPLHLEVPSTKLLLIIEGGAYGEIVSTNFKTTRFNLFVQQLLGSQQIEVCGKAKEVLRTSTDGGAFVQSGEELTQAVLTFGAEEEFM